MKTHALPQTLTGTELVTVHQMQGGVWVECTMPLSMLVPLLTPLVGLNPASLPTSRPSTSGVLWNDAGVVSIS
jgi:hypothetical protein